MLCLTGVSCGPPQPLENGWFQGMDFQAGSSVEYQCNTGFYLLGDTKVHCANSGKWGGNSPACLGNPPYRLLSVVLSDDTCGKELCYA